MAAQVMPSNAKYTSDVVVRSSVYIPGLQLYLMAYLFCAAAQ